MKTVATLSSAEIAILTQILRTRGIVFEIRSSCEETGLGLSDLMVEDHDYELACDLIEAFEEGPASDQWTKSAPEPTRAIDVSKLKPKIEEVRRQHLRNRNSTRLISFHRTLLEMFHGAIARLPYFRDRNPEERGRTNQS